MMTEGQTARPGVARETVLQVEHVEKVFRDFWRRPRVRAVSDLSFEIHAGEVYGLLGPNGSGKSTTLKMIVGLLRPTRGQIRVLGGSPTDVQRKSRLGYLPEDSRLYPYLTAEETLEFFAKLFDLAPPERRQRIEQLLDMVGLRHVRRRAVGEFSKGMTRRIGLAQTLINDPDLVILDEPTAGLDPLGCRQVKDLILTLARRGKAVLLSSHLLADVEDVCDRIGILFNGKLQATGPIRDLLEERRRPRLTLPELAPEQLRMVLELLRERLGREPDLDYPRRNLEQFFLDTVAQAMRQPVEPTGATPSEAIAPYLTSAPTAPDRPPSTPDPSR